MDRNPWNTTAPDAALRVSSPVSIHSNQMYRSHHLHYYIHSSNHYWHLGIPGSKHSLHSAELFVQFLVNSSNYFWQFFLWWLNNYLYYKRPKPSRLFNNISFCCQFPLKHINVFTSIWYLHIHIFFKDHDNCITVQFIHLIYIHSQTEHIYNIHRFSLWYITIYIPFFFSSTTSSILVNACNIYTIYLFFIIYMYQNV